MSVMRSKFLLDNEILNMDDFYKHYFHDPNNVYEVVRIINCKVLFWDEHLIRLKRSITMFNGNSVNLEGLFTKVERVISENFIRYGNLKIEIIFNDNGYKLFIYPIEFFYPSSSVGASVVTYKIERSNPNIKNYDYQFRSKIQKLVNDRNVYEVLLVNRYGFITEGSRSNVYFMRDNRFFTAPEKFILPGVTRMKVNELIKHMGFKLVEECVSEKELFEFDACFLTSTSSNILPIVSINGIDVDSLLNNNLNTLVLNFEKYLKSR